MTAKDKGMKSLKYILAVLIVVGCFCFTNKAKAQCAACAATVESNADNGNNQAKGLNNGILFLLAAPYLAAAVGGYIWYKKYRRKDVDLNMRNEKIHLN